MSREKQIEEQAVEEMAKAMCGNGMPIGNCATDDTPCELECVYGCCAVRLYSKGYRKQSEGEWIWMENGEADYEQYWVCSVCKEHDFVKTKYCPNCGAHMKGGAE